MRQFILYVLLIVYLKTNVSFEDKYYRVASLVDLPSQSLGGFILRVLGSNKSAFAK